MLAMDILQKYFPKTLSYGVTFGGLGVQKTPRVIRPAAKTNKGNCELKAHFDCPQSTQAETRSERYTL